MFLSDAFRRIAAELAANDVPDGNDQPWILFADIATTVANPLYRLEDLLRYTLTIVADPKQPFYGRDGPHSPPGQSSPSTATNSTANTTSTLQAIFPLSALPSKCHMIGQLSPTSISVNMLLFPITATAHRILLDWSLAMQRMATHAGPWHSHQVQLESVVLSHLHNVLEKEYNNATGGYRRLQSESAVAPADHRRSLPAHARIRTTKAVHPTHLHHLTKREYKTKQAIKGEMLKLQFHQRQKRQQEQQRRNKDAAENADEGDGDRAVDQANDLLLVDGAGHEFNLWSLVFGGNKNQKASTRHPHAAKSTAKHPPVRGTFQGLPHGLCIRMKSDVEREQCFGRTMRAFSLFWDTSRVAPFCLLAGHTPMAVFNTADWPLEQRSGVVTSGHEPQYTAVVAAAKLRLSAVPEACRRIFPPFYGGKNATTIRAIPLWSEMTPAQRTALKERYESGLRETERRDRQRVSPRATIATRTECDVFWTSYLVRHVDAWEEEDSASPQRVHPQHHHQRASNGPARPKAPPKPSPARSKGRSIGH